MTFLNKFNLLLHHLNSLHTDFKRPVNFNNLHTPNVDTFSLAGYFDFTIFYHIRYDTGYKKGMDDKLFLTLPYLFQISAYRN